MLTNRTIFLPMPKLSSRPLRYLTSLLVSFAAMVAVAQAPTPPIQIQLNAPDSHVVVRGDTL